MPGVNPDSQRVNFELDLDIKRKATDRARAEGTSLTAIVSASLRAYGDGAKSVRFPTPPAPKPVARPADKATGEARGRRRG